MIGVLGPLAAQEEGTCNGCDTQITSGGLVPESEVYLFQAIKHHGNQSMSFRLCLTCVHRLQATLNTLFPLEDQCTG